MAVGAIGPAKMHQIDYCSKSSMLDGHSDLLVDDRAFHYFHFHETMCDLCQLGVR